MKSKICGIKDKKTLKYILNHSYPPEFIGFICNYKKSKRFIKFNKLKELTFAKKKKSKFVAVLVKPSNEEIKKISKLPIDYFQLYDMKPDEIKLIKNKYKKKNYCSINN